MRSAIEDIEVKTGREKELLQTRQLSSFLGNLVDFKAVSDKVEKRLRDRNLAEILIQAGLEQRSQLNLEKLQSLGEQIKKLGYEIEIGFDEEHSLHKLILRGKADNGNHQRTIDHEFISLPEYKRAVALTRSLAEYDKPPFMIFDKEKGGAVKAELSSREALLETILTTGKKDFHIQRYKGLGEMNPAQLWETTMNVDTRSLLQVRIDDAVETDEIFTILMGDAVEPRRKFIEDNALDVKNLDI
jgi:DNA gyrase subunit B